MAPYKLFFSLHFWGARTRWEKKNFPLSPGHFSLFHPPFAASPSDGGRRRRKGERKGHLSYTAAPTLPFPVRRFCLQQCFFSLLPFLPSFFPSFLRLCCRYKWPVGYITCLIQAEGKEGGRGKEKGKDGHNSRQEAEGEKEREGGEEEAKRNFLLMLSAK